MHVSSKLLEHTLEGWLYKLTGNLSDERLSAIIVPCWLCIYAPYLHRVLCADNIILHIIQNKIDNSIHAPFIDMVTKLQWWNPSHKMQIPTAKISMVIVSKIIPLLQTCHEFTAGSNKRAIYLLRPTSTENWHLGIINKSLFQFTITTDSINNSL